MDKNIKELIEYSEKGILSKEILKNEKVDMTLFCMASETEIDEHTSTRQGFVYVIEGEGEFILEGKSIKMEKDKLIYMKANAVHSLKANKNTAFLWGLFKDGC